MGVGKVFHFVEGKYSLHQRAYRIHVTSDPPSLFHSSVTTLRVTWRPSRFTRPSPRCASRCSRSTPFPCRPLSSKHATVQVLDKLEALMNDLSVGLPAELKARRQQYEHYRDRLLTFPEAA